MGTYSGSVHGNSLKRGTLVQVHGLNISDHTTRDYPAECGMINGYVNSLLIIRSKHNVLLVLI